MKIKLAKVLGVVMLCLGLGGLIGAPVFADDVFCDQITDEKQREQLGCDVGKDAFPNTIKNIIDAVVAVGGLVAVIYVVIGGYGYMTAQGDASKLQKAKSTILYAVIGLIICALAFAIVNFAIDGLGETATTQTNQSATSQP